MNIINLFDDIFSHTKTSSDTYPTDFRYVRNEKNFNGITIFTDNHLRSNIVDTVTSPYKIGWLCESKSVMPYTIESIKTIENKFDYFFTHDKELINYNPEKFLFVIPASWRGQFPDHDVNFYENKQKLVSFCYSHKTMTNGHRYRHEIAKLVKDKVDLMGMGANKFFPHTERVRAYKDYMFTIIIENDDYDYYYSEKIMEPYWAGTIPIYWGGSHNDNEIKKVFDIDLNGIITFNNTEDLLNIINSLDKNLYENKKMHVKNNYDIFTKPIYRIGSEEFFYEKYIHKYFMTGELKNLISCVI